MLSHVAAHLISIKNHTLFFRSHRGEREVYSIDTGNARNGRLQKGQTPELHSGGARQEHQHNTNNNNTTTKTHEKQPQLRYMR
jgi:hypothetical protein